MNQAQSYENKYLPPTLRRRKSPPFGSESCYPPKVCLIHSRLQNAELKSTFATGQGREEGLSGEATARAGDKQNKAQNSWGSWCIRGQEGSFQVLWVWGLRCELWVGVGVRYGYNGERGTCNRCGVHNSRSKKREDVPKQWRGNEVRL